ncbi:SDR family oxidoreductase [Mucilaginibacter sp. L3T2-6]|uniref:SDR family oxidoreductase n=1 Tax=Mucilaginibacter sp. L3T2-6 TaxID=3062491 RepID=UPI0026747762|nr:SDR family oxidoreductase [Mucilaginibacter sp. L3T2-6]MDO3643320.1 SDR family oxidoreductase [Mucilaginibacter sp. L3T2-6]MDV6215747.1 SDR family oxidoreductase [Mucilaginibacter sp. L3T2-6]
MTISILGCGWYGKALATALIADGHRVKGSATSAEKLAALADAGIEPFVVDFKADQETYTPEFFACDVLIISIPPRTRHGEGSDYLRKIQRIIDAVTHYGGKNVIYISSTAVYGESCTEVTEADIPKPDTASGEILLQAENLFNAQQTLKTTIIRFGGLVGHGRHPGRFFAGKKNVPNGRAPVNLVHLTDCIGISKVVIRQNKFGLIINGVAPHHPQKMNFYRRAAAQAGLEIPQFMDELNAWKIVDSTVLLQELNYQFSVANWDDCNFI